MRWFNQVLSASILALFLPLPSADGIWVYRSAAQYYEVPDDVMPDGTKIPDWIQSTCCGAQDAHKLRADQIYRKGNDHGDEWWEIEGYYGPGNSSGRGALAHIPDSQVKPSQDGDYWAFYRDFGNGGQTQLYCFFIPMGT